MAAAVVAAETGAGATVATVAVVVVATAAVIAAVATAVVADRAAKQQRKFIYQKSTLQKGGFFIPFPKVVLWRQAAREPPIHCCFILRS